MSLRTQRSFTGVLSVLVTVAISASLAWRHAWMWMLAFYVVVECQLSVIAVLLTGRGFFPLAGKTVRWVLGDGRSWEDS